VTTIYGFEMELIRGYTVDEYWYERGCEPFSEPEALQICWQTATTLSGFHALGIYHRDIKPENMMLDKHNDRVYLIDLGFSTESRNGEDTYIGHSYNSAPESLPGLPSYQLWSADVY